MIKKLAVILTLGIGASAFAAPLNTPFTDYITFNLKNFPQNLTLNMNYINNNDVDFTNQVPSVNTNQGSFKARIHSTNQFENGYPTMNIQSTTGLNCSIGFSDGPLEPLGYNNKPSCAHINVSDITFMSGTEVHEITLTYHA